MQQAFPKPTQSTGLHLNQKPLLRLSTAGSVDDGKSTLIGRLLYDAKGLFDDQIRKLESSPQKGGKTSGTLDLAALTDGLKSEQEQGITIDVAYRYFATPARKFIIADTPGHEQYTRNMATGASTADCALILVDAERGITDQTIRHLYIAVLLGIRHVVVAVNKMDLVNYSPLIFEVLKQKITGFCTKLQMTTPLFIPISALSGVNVCERSLETHWYEGPTLLEYLEGLEVNLAEKTVGPRLAVQLVLRPNRKFRGFAGMLVGGSLAVGDEITVMPSGLKSKIASIHLGDRSLNRGLPGQSLVVTLKDEIDISRGAIIAAGKTMPLLSDRLRVAMVWMAGKPCEPGQKYLVKNSSGTVRGVVSAIHHKTNVKDLSLVKTEALDINELGLVDLELFKAVPFDTYDQCRATGNLILIDPITNQTVGAGMVQGPVPGTGQNWEV